MCETLVRVTVDARVRAPVGGGTTEKVVRWDGDTRASVPAAFGDAREGCGSPHRQRRSRSTDAVRRDVERRRRDERSDGCAREWCS